VSTPEDAAEGHRRAGELVRLLAEDDAAADALLAGLSDVRDLVFVGAGLTAIARAEGHRLPPAHRAQASTRQIRLGQLRDAQRGDPGGLRAWLRAAAEEILLIRSLQEAADRAVQPAAGRTAATASGSIPTSTPATTT
jgi:hypothetical protein